MSRVVTVRRTIPPGRALPIISASFVGWYAGGHFIAGSAATEGERYDRMVEIGWKPLFLRESDRAGSPSGETQ